MPEHQRLFRLPLIAAAALVLSSCDDKSQQNNTPQAGPAAVTVTTLTPQKVPLVTELPGRTVAFRVAEVRPQVSGIILKRLFEEGSEVKAGQQLYQIDPDTYQATLLSAQADLSRARANVQSLDARAARYADLVKINAVSKQDYDDAVANLAQAKAQVLVAEAAVQTARINLNYTKVYAAISGRIGKSNMTEGALVTANQSAPMATITQLDPIYVDVSQSSSELMRLRRAVSAGLVQQGQAKRAPVTLTLDGSAEAYDQPGQMQFSDVTVDQTTGALQVRAVFPNPRNELYPGLFVRARIEQGMRDNALLVPQKSLMRNPDGSAAVWVVGPDNKVNRRQVVIGQAIGNRWLVNEGLQPGERVVVEGSQRVRPGIEVRPTNASTADAADPGHQQ